MKPETQKCLYDILQASRDIEDFTRELEPDDFQASPMTQSAVERKFEIIGEALTRIGRSDPDTLELIPDHKRIIGFRNLIAYGYDVVDVEIVWDAATEFLPVLVGKVEALLNA